MCQQSVAKLTDVTYHDNPFSGYRVICEQMDGTGEVNRDVVVNFYWKRAKTTAVRDFEPSVVKKCTSR
jgi:hypothetical protein